MHSNTDEKILIEAGLSEEQAAVYSSLLDKGPLKAGSISSWTGIKRGLIYKVLDQLESMGLISKKGGEGTVAVFAPEHPSRLAEIMERKEKSIALAKETVMLSLGSLSSKFNLLSGKPNVQFFEGIEGIQKVYEDLLVEKNDILLIQSPFDADLPELKSIILKQIEKQVANNIHTRVITPLIEITKDWVHKDEENLVTRCIVPEKTFEIPAQIIIYGNKIGISSVKNPFITTIIEDANICDSFKIMFEYIWKVSQEDHEEIMKSLRHQ